MEEDFKVDVETGVSSYGFYDLHESTATWTSFREAMKCIDEPFDIYGDFNSNSASNLMVAFEKCDQEKNPQVTCESKEVIDKWLEYKYILV